ncbi:MAG: sigma-70 family RNA polymerase sigma factor [Oscillospiraceae bacterium]|nr:sigma-70 family RNA polymerase sigma factor [Oscillospiraceae bacterium]
MEWTREEFAAAVAEHSRSMYRAARAVLDSDADAQDAVAQAVLQGWQSLDALRDKAAVRPWLVRIAVNCAYAQRRRQGRVVYLDDLAQEPAAPEPPRYDGLWEAVSALPPDRRAAVVLFYYEDMGVEEIARCLGIPRGTVKSRLSRARKQLKEMLCDEEGSYGTV